MFSVRKRTMANVILHTHGMIHAVVPLFKKNIYNFGQTWPLYESVLDG